jgi:translocation and assembly module TamB
MAQRILLAGLVGVILIGAPLLAQQDQTTEQTEAAPEESAGFLERQIQNVLGGEGRYVRVIGLQGVLSSEASIARIEIADDDGTWLIVRDIVLDWSRLALLRRRLEVNALTVAGIEVLRKPLPGPEAPPALAAEADPQPFALPDLPVSVNVQQLSVGGLVLDEPVIGQAVSLSINGSARLANGEGAVDIGIVRIDGQAGRYTLNAGFDNESRNLLVDLDVIEDAGGLIATLSGMPGAPSLELTVSGDAPISDFTATINLKTDEIDRLSGTVTLTDEAAPDGATANTQVIAATIAGDVADLFLPDYRDFFGRELALDLLARRNPETGLSIERLTLDTLGLTLSGSADLTAAFLPQRIDLQAAVANPLGLPVILPVPGTPTLVRRADLSLRYDEATGESLTLALLADGVMRTDGLLIDTVRLDFDGSLVKDGDTALASAGGDLTAAMDGFSTTNRALWEAVQDDLTAQAAIDWTNGGPLTIAGLDLTSGEDLTLTGDAEVTGLQTGTIAVSADLSAEAGSLTRFSALSGQDLSGALAADLTASYDLASKAFDVDLDGRGTDLAFGDANADTLLEGDSRLQLSAARTTDGITIDTLALDARQIELNGRAAIDPTGYPTLVDVTGRLGNPDGNPVRLPLPGAATDLQSADLSLSYDAASGEAFSAVIDANGLTRADGIVIGAAVLRSEGTLVRGDGMLPQALDATLRASVTDASATEAGLDTLLAEGFSLDADLSADLVAGTAALRSLTARSGDLSVTGRADATGLTGDDLQATAQVQLDSGPLARFAALTGQDLSGRVAASTDVSFAAASGFFTVDLDGNVTDLALGRADIDPLLAGRADLTIEASRDDSGIAVKTLRLTSPVADLTGDIALAPDFWPRRAVLTGRLANRDGSPLPVPGQQLTLGGVDLDVQYDAAQNDSFTAQVVASDLAGPQGLQVGRGLVSADGQLQRGEGTAISQVLAAIRAEISNATATDPALRAAVDQGLQVAANVNVLPGAGTGSLRDLTLTSGALNLSGEADVTGLDAGTPAVAVRVNLATGALSRFAPLVGQPLRGSLTAQADAAYDTANGFFEVDLTADGSDLAIGIAEVDQLIGGPAQIRLQASQDAEGLELPQLSVTTRELNVQASGGMQTRGGTIDLTAELRDLGVLVEGFPGAVRVTGQALNRGDIWGVDLALTGPGGTTAQVNGDVLRPDGTINVRANGGLPLGLANRILAPRSIEGNLTFDVTVNGPPALQSVSGELRVGGARLADPTTRLALENLGATVALANSEARLDVGGDLSSGGRITASGPIGLTGTLPANLQIALINLKLVDPRIYEIDLGGNITVDGPLAGGAVIAGRIDIDRAEIKIPSGLGGAASIPEIFHVGEPGPSIVTRRRAGLIVEDRGSGGGGGGGSGRPYPLDIVISAPREIFVRGRGLDAELGGRFEIGGTTANPAPTGELSLIRGRLNLLARRLEFTEATISMQGDLVPDIRMVASSTNDSITASIVVEGPITDPEITFSSQPELPEDEVLSQLFFDKPLGDLTPLELAQLAAALRTLTGRGGGGLFESIRQGLGVDDLNVSTDAEGETQVTAGKYLTEQIYTDVTVGADGSTEIQLNYELRSDFSVRGSYDNNGNTGVGITFERDY